MMIKERLLEFVENNLGRVLLLVSLVLTTWVTYANRPITLPDDLTKVEPRPVYVELDKSALSEASAESYYAAGPGEIYQLAKLHIFVPEIIAPQFTPVELGIPPLSVMRAPQLLPDPGPSLQGADKLPRFGDEFTPPSAADLPPPPKKLGSERTTATGTVPSTTPAPATPR